MSHSEFDLYDKTNKLVIIFLNIHVGKLRQKETKLTL